MDTGVKDTPGWRIAQGRVVRAFFNQMQWLMGSVNGGTDRELRTRLERILIPAGEKPHMLL